MNKSELEAKFLELGVGDVWNSIQSQTRNAIKMTLTETDESKIPVGSSKIGGKPDLPPGFQWPFEEDKPLPFVAQINLSETKPYDLENELPASGMLYFFNDIYDCWRDDLPHLTRWYSGGAELARTSPPENIDEEHVLPAHAVSFGTETNVPNPESDWCNELKEDARERYREKFSVEWSGWENMTRYHKLLGHSDNSQGGMELDCQSVSSGDSNSPNGAPGTKPEWKLLLQLDTEDNFMFGDMGRLHLWIHERDLAERNFDNTCLMIEGG